MKTLSLDGTWQIKGFSFREGEPKDAGHGLVLRSGVLDQQGWIPAQVPGDIHNDLMAAGELEFLYYGDAIARNKWTKEKEWWYQREFTVSAQDLSEVSELVFKGIDTMASIYLNGEKIGRCENMFREYRFDVSDKLHLDSPNTLWVCVEPITIVMKQYDADPYFACFNDHRIFIRKAQCHFGWDWAPDCPGAGIWNSVQLQSYAKIRLDGVNLHAHNNGAVTFFITLNDAVQSAEVSELKLKIELFDSEGNPLCSELWPVTGIKNFRNLFVKNPEIWWPNGMGEPALYSYEITLLLVNTIVDTQQGRLGFREVQLEEAPLSSDKIGFAFVVNGQHCFCKGANWVPLDNFTGSISEAKYRHMLQLVKQSGMNMLRVWGGGIYEKDIFYDLCDEMGIMVWQDFMFACGDVPDNHAWFVDNVREEVIYQIKRLRTHTSLVYWVGGNEKSGDFYRKMVNYGDSLFDEMIPGLLQTHDPFRPYRRGSPYAYIDSGNHPKSGDSHLSALAETFAPDSKGFFDYRNCVNHIDSSFNSEFALQGPARRSSFEKFMPPERYWPIDDLWNYRITCNPYDHHDRRSFAEKQLALCQAFFGEPKGHVDFIKYGMTIHAEAMWDEMFGYRCKRPGNSGSMFWMYSDPWPTGSWSVVDWYGMPKAAYYAAKRASQPLQIGWKNRADEKGWQLVVCNDTLQSYQGILRFGEENVNGEKAWQRELSVDIQPNASAVLVELETAAFSAQKDAFLVAELDCAKERRRDTFFPNFWKEVSWPEPGLEIQNIVSSSEGRVEVTLTCQKYARCVHLEGLAEGCSEGEPVYVSDAFFDMRAGEYKTLVLQSNAAIAVQNLRLAHWLTNWT
jgi:beta-mannosidase